MKINHGKKNLMYCQFLQVTLNQTYDSPQREFSFLSEKGCRLQLTDLKAILEFSYINDNASLNYRVKKIVK